MRNKFVSVQGAVELVRDGDTLCIGGFGSHGVPEALLQGLEQLYSAELSSEGVQESVRTRSALFACVQSAVLPDTDYAVAGLTAIEYS